jgi:hypothetical protein
VPLCPRLDAYITIEELHQSSFSDHKSNANFCYQ